MITIKDKKINLRNALSGLFRHARWYGKNNLVLSTMYECIIEFSLYIDNNFYTFFFNNHKHKSFLINKIGTVVLQIGYKI